MVQIAQNRANKNLANLASKRVEVVQYAEEKEDYFEVEEVKET